MNKFLVLTGVALFLSIPAAFAEHGDTEGHGGKGEMKLERMFEKGDKDGDGVISKEEFLANAEERFTAMDADADGKVTKEEAKAHHEEMRAKWKELKDKKEGDVPPAAEEPKAAE